MYYDLRRPWAEYAAELKQWEIDAANNKRLPLVVDVVLERYSYEWWTTSSYLEWMKKCGPGKL